MRNLSVSKMESYLLCPLQFRYKYVDRIPQMSVGILHAGIVVHEIVEFALKDFARNGKYADWKTLDDMFLPTWERKKAQTEGKDTFVGWKWDVPEEQAKLRYRPLVRVAREQALPKLKPWMLGDQPMVEHRLDLELQSEVGPFQLLGYIDLLDESGILMDWKTSSKDEVSKRQKRLWLQFAGYSLYVWPIVGDETIHCQKIFLVPGAQPHVEWCDFHVGPAHRKYFVELAAEIWKSIHYGIYPAKNEGWHCSQDFCSFWGPCQGPLVGAAGENV
jgi:CRISPR/Cas system-associated exonuclease Cas4 (RecB family)